MDVSQNPANISKYQNNPKIQRIIQKLSNKFGGGAGGSEEPMGGDDEPGDAGAGAPGGSSSGGGPSASDLGVD